MLKITLSAPRQRLCRLFDRYNRLYWREKLSDCDVTCVHLKSSMGRYDPLTRTIMIDIAKHRSARELRSTLLHEMCHAAAHQRGGQGHGEKFFEQLEHLLRKKAPISIADPEAGKAHIRAELVPARFAMLRRKMGRIEIGRAHV